MAGSKTRPPRQWAAVVDRPRLGQVLAGDHSLVLVRGPAGSGKTVLVGQWLAGPLDRPVAWLTLDPRDNWVRLRYADALRRAREFPAATREFHAVLHSTERAR